MDAPRPLGGESLSETASASDVQNWFSRHVTLDGKPYTLDLDQARAVLDMHKNTLVVARAGSGKTRVIVAKIAFLVATSRAHLSEILAFMFNRTAAAEVNARISAVKVDGKALPEYDCATSKISVASTFHKFALDIVQLAGDRPDILTEARHAEVINQALSETFAHCPTRIPLRDREEYAKLTSSFIARAGQKYPGRLGLKTLRSDLLHYFEQHAGDESYTKSLRIHKIAFNAYKSYLDKLSGNLTDFNLLMQRASEVILRSGSTPNPISATLSSVKYLLVDEYQDFSFLFFALIKSIRELCPAAHLFAVGDDWQAINRFAGSDVGYFINFCDYFSEDCVTIPLLTNYRSAKAIVENANDYMLSNYDSSARRAVPFSRDPGKIHRLKISKTHFDTQDFYEDALGDGRFQVALLTALGGDDASLDEVTKLSFLPVLKLLKLTYKVIKKHRNSEIMLLHRHNFLSTGNIYLSTFLQALRTLLINDAIMSETDFDQRIRCMTMHKSKGLESEIVILLELDWKIVLSGHPYARLFTIFGDSVESEKSDQHRLLYVALTRAKKRLYILTSDDSFIA